MAFRDHKVVPRLVYASRVAPAAVPPLSLVATFGDRVVGHVMLSACRSMRWLGWSTSTRCHRWACCLSIRGEGIGTALVERALAAADQRGVPLVFLEGSSRYYGKRGFRAAEELGVRPLSLRYPPGAFQVARLPPTRTG